MEGRSSAVSGRAGPFDESYFVGGLKSNYVDYSESEEAIDVGFMPVVRRYARQAGAGRTARVYLDIGCAFGFYVERLARAGWDASGVDVSEYAIGRGQARGVRGLYVAPAQDLPFPDGSFDFVTAIDVIEHIPADEAPAAVAETWRVLREGGLAFFATPNFVSNTRWNVNTQGFTDPDVTHINYQSVESFRQLFERFSTCRILGHTPFVDQFHAFEGGGGLTRSVLRIPGTRALARQVAWRFLGNRLGYSSYLHAVATK